MVTAVTSFGRSGVYDWLIQRVAAVVLTAYTIFLVIYVAIHPELNFAQWSELYSHLWMRVFSVITLVSFLAHGWIGLWSVVTDYMSNHLMGPKAAKYRILVQVLLGLVAVTYLVWGIEILWGF